MKTLSSELRSHVAHIHGLVPVAVGVGQRFAQCTRLDQVDVDVVGSRRTRPIAETVQSIQKIANFQIWHAVFSIRLLAG